MEAREERRFQRGVQALEALVAVVATLGELATVIRRAHGDAPPAASGASLRRFSRRLESALRPGAVTSAGHRRGLVSLGQALPALVANPEAPWARAYVTAVAGAWLASVDALEDGWAWLSAEAAELRQACQAAAAETGQAAEVEALEALRRLVTACDEAAALPRELRRRVEEIRTALEWTREVTVEFCLALAAEVTLAEQLWKAGGCLAEHHLLGALADIGGLWSRRARWWAWLRGVLGGRTVAERCQKAAEDVPRLLREERCRHCGAVGGVTLSEG